MINSNVFIYRSKLSIYLQPKKHFLNLKKFLDLLNQDVDVFTMNNLFWKRFSKCFSNFLKKFHQIFATSNFATCRFGVCLSDRSRNGMRIWELSSNWFLVHMKKVTSISNFTPDPPPIPKFSKNFKTYFLTISDCNWIFWNGIEFP